MPRWLLAAALAAACLFVIFAAPASARSHARAAAIGPVTQFCGARYCAVTQKAAPVRELKRRTRLALRHPSDIGTRRWRDRHAARHARTAAVSRGPHLDDRTRSLIAIINAKLARWVHPTGKCGSASEQLATFYWQGRRTATGERFNPRGMTAASRHLAFGTRLTITNPHNGRSVLVVINDRGPYTRAQLDLALGAAQALGLRQSSYVCVSR